jgi:hypothetical protein
MTTDSRLSELVDAEFIIGQVQGRLRASIAEKVVQSL